MRFSNGVSPAAHRAEASGVGETGHGRGAGRGDVGDAGVRQRVLQAQSGPALLGRLGLAALGLRPGRVGHRVRLVEHHDPVEGVAILLVERAGQPFDDLLQPRRLPLPGRRAQRGVGREQNPRVERDLHSLAEVAERDDVALQSAECGPVAARVLQQLVGLREPERFFRPRSRLSRMIAATCRPLPQPVPSPSIQPGGTGPAPTGSRHPG